MATTKEIPLLMTEREAARECQVSLNTLAKERKRADSTIPYRMIGKQIRYERDSLKRWFEQR